MSSPAELRERQARLDRLRKLGLRPGVRALPARPAQAPSPPETASDPAAAGASGVRLPALAILPGEPVDTPFGEAWLRTAVFPLASHPELAEWLRVAPQSLVALDRTSGLSALDPSRAAFIDTETTGLSLGAGTYTFLIGVGTYETRTERADPQGLGAFVVRQFFMRNPGEERAQLHMVQALLASCTGIVSFNGRGFDMPLIANRFVLAEMPPPLPGAPHLDLLPPARRLWRARWGSCSLGSLEQNVLGVRRKTEDVPGYMIPDIYRQYYRTGVVTDMLVQVFYHNLQDILSMALLATTMARHFTPDGLDARLSALHPIECLSLGRCYDAVNWSEAGILAYRMALDHLAVSSELAQAFRELGYLYKRLERREEAAEVWEAWISTAPGNDLTPYVELAKHHEWSTGDLPAARGWVGWAMKITEGWAPGFARDETLAELQHRLARLERKLAGEPAENVEAA